MVCGASFRLRQPLCRLEPLPRSRFRFLGGLKLLLDPSLLDFSGALHDRANFGV
jgi:hypothetical protein